MVVNIKAPADRAVELDAALETAMATTLNKRLKVDGVQALSEESRAFARDNMGLGDSAVRDIGTGAGTTAAGDDSRIVNAVQPADLTAANYSSEAFDNMLVLEAPGVVRRGFTAGGYSLKNFGTPAVGNDWTLVLESAVDSGEAITVPRGEFILEGADVSVGNIRSGLRLIGEDRFDSILKLADSANASLIAGENIDDLKLENLTIDANKANQSLGSGNNWRGVYLLGNCSRITVRDLIVKNAQDHGFFLSSGASVETSGIDSLIENLYISGCGSQAHIDAGGAGGSGAAGGTESTVWISVNSTGNRLNGMKTVGKHIACNSYGNTGGGFETGFSTPTIYHQQFINCTAKDNGGDGIRNQGQGNRLSIIGCKLIGNDQSGISLFGPLARATLADNWIYNNGQSGTRDAANNWGLDGIYLGETVSLPSGLIMTGNHLFDDQGSPTQEYAVYFNNSTKHAAPIVFDASNEVGTHKTGQVRLTASALNDDAVRLGDYVGSPANFKNTVPVTVTGTTSITDLMTTTIKASSLPMGMVLRGVASGAATGTNGTKIVALVVGGTSITVVSQAAGDQQEWIVTWTISRMAGTRLLVQYFADEVGGQHVEGAVALAQSGASDLTVRLRGTLGNAADSIVQNFMSLSAE